MSKEKILAMQKQVTGKLMAAISMLLVSAILMCLTSYAWFILSTAPEVSNLKTTAGANGALEIALQSTNEAGNGRADITSAVGSSHAKNAATVSNTYWGNVVDLTNGYGLDNIQLYPSRLKVNATTVDGKTSYQVDPSTILQVPQFGQDGRVTSLLNATKTHYDSKTGKFTTGANWGVNVLGAVNADKEDQGDTIILEYGRDIVLKQAREKVAAYRADLRSDMTSLIERNSRGIWCEMLKILDTVLIEPEEEEILVRDYVASMDAVLTDAVEAVRWAFLANVAADETRYSSENAEQMKALGEIYANFMQLPLTGENSIQNIADANGYTDISEAADTMTSAMGRIATAKDFLNKSKPDVTSAGLMLVRVNEMFIHGNPEQGPINEFMSGFAYDVGAQIPRDTIYMVRSISDPTNTNLFSAIASVIGDYCGDMSIWFLPGEGVIVQDEPENSEGWLNWIYTLKATSGPSYDAWRNVDDLASVEKQVDGTYAEDANVGALGVVLNQIEGIEAPGVIQVEVKRPDVTAYGYSVDLAFKASENTNLLLQQTGIGRVSGDGEDLDLLGGGSTVEFTVAGDMTTEQVKDLLQGVYIVFMNTVTGTIYRVAAVDPDSVVVTWTAFPARATATLALYEPEFDGEGNLSLGRKVTDNVITALTADTPYYISEVVYLNGDAVDTTAFSATQELSLSGAMNLQFASSVQLVPMTYTDYKRKE